LGYGCHGLSRSQLVATMVEGYAAKLNAKLNAKPESKKEEPLKL